MGTLNELRQLAALPVNIKPTGLNGALQSAAFSAFLNDKKDTILAPEAEKLSILRQLMAMDELTDVSIESANLNQLYQHFLNQGKKASTAAQEPR
jgi:Cu-processing system ATP-binding protein